jgi:hypothetical protein
MDELDIDTDMDNVSNEEIFIKFASFGILKNVLHQTKILRDRLLSLKIISRDKLQEFKNNSQTSTDQNYNSIYTFLEMAKETLNNLDTVNKNFMTKLDKYTDTLDKYNLELDEFSKKINDNKLDYGLQGQLKSTFRKTPSKPVMTAEQEEMYDELMSNPDIKVGTYGRGGKQRTNKKRKTNKRKQTKRNNKRKKTNKKY